MGFSKQEYWSGLPFPSPEDLPDPESNPSFLHRRQILYHLSYREVLCVCVCVCKTELLKPTHYCKSNTLQLKKKGGKMESKESNPPVDSGVTP